MANTMASGGAGVSSTVVYSSQEVGRLGTQLGDASEEYVKLYGEVDKIMETLKNDFHGSLADPIIKDYEDAKEIFDAMKGYAERFHQGVVDNNQMGIRTAEQALDDMENVRYKI